MTYVPIPPQDGQGDDEEAAGLSGDSGEEVQEPSQGEQSSPAEQPPSPADAATAKLPPEAQGELHGGPLGCCLGVTVGLLLSTLLGVLGFGHNLAFLLSFVLPLDALTLVRIATGCISVAGAIIAGFVGWKVGKRFYREYEPPVIKDRRRKSKPKEV
jgi:hypothetical protein